jgi:hypothetical protein
LSTSTAHSISLSALGNLPEAYQHEWRVATPRQPIVVSGGIFKWYHVHRQGVGVCDELDERARRVIVDGAASGWDLSYGLNFALLHVSTTHAFLLVETWRGHQEMWVKIYAYDLAQGGPFIRGDVTGEDTPSACVWEMGVIAHERMAWHRYLFSERADADKRAWLDDSYAGSV